MGDLLDAPVASLRGVGERRRRLLAGLGIHTLRDLLFHLPRAYRALPALRTIAELEVGDIAAVCGRLRRFEVRRRRGGQGDLVARLADGTGTIGIVWFQQPYLGRRLRPDDHVVVWGRVRRYRGLEMASPAFRRLAPGELDATGKRPRVWEAGRWEPVYPLASGLSQKWITAWVGEVLERVLPDLEELVPPRLAPELPFPARSRALATLHGPGTAEGAAELVRAYRRLVFDELLVTTVAVRRWRLRQSGRSPRPAVGAALPERVARLPFALTASQRRSLAEIVRDLRGSQVMHRLLQGDVGSGKTVVALLAAAAVIDAGMQSALLAPTELLARQHARAAGKLLPDRRIALLTGAAQTVVEGPELGPSAGAGARRALIESIASAEIDLVIGTHALLSGDVRFARLGLVIVDEEQRFGVAQRAALTVKGEAPDMLVMTATPIPRSLALTCFGELDQSTIDELPAGRQLPTTYLAEPGMRERLLRYLDAEIGRGRQVMVVTPRIDAGDDDLASAVDCFERTRSHPRLGQRRLALLHGRLPAAERDRVLARLRRRELDLIVTTTVIEVGLDLPSLGVMVIENPHRFGLSQLHQLRGRVGRGPEPGVCILVLAGDTDAAATARLDRFRRTASGFEVAELDAETRGIGEILGGRQHGFQGLELADVPRDRVLLESARRLAECLLRDDPELESCPELRREVERIEGSRSCMQWTAG